MTRDERDAREKFEALVRIIEVEGAEVSPDVVKRSWNILIDALDNAACTIVPLARPERRTGR